MNIMDQVKEQLKTEIAAAIEAAGLARGEDVPEIVLETPKEKSHGDFASNAAMKLASVAKKAPKAIAEDIVNHLNTNKASVKEVEIAGPGFINFFMDNRYLIDVIPEVLD